MNSTAVTQINATQNSRLDKHGSIRFKLMTINCILSPIWKCSTTAARSQDSFRQFRFHFNWPNFFPVTPRQLSRGVAVGWTNSRAPPPQSSRHFCLSNAMYSIAQNIKSLQRPSGDRPPCNYGQDCELTFGPIFTKFGTQLPLNIPKKIFCKQSLKWAWPGSRDPLNFSALNANISKTVKAMDFKFYVNVSNVSRDSLDITP